MKVARIAAGYRIEGPGPDVELANRYLAHLATRNFSTATVRTYAFHLLSFLRFTDEHQLELGSVTPTDIFDFLAWLGLRPPKTASVVPVGVRLGASPSTLNQRIAAVRGLFEYAVVTGLRQRSPVPVSHRASGLAV